MNGVGPFGMKILKFINKHKKMESENSTKYTEIEEMIPILEKFPEITRCAVH